MQTALMDKDFYFKFPIRAAIDAGAAILEIYEESPHIEVKQKQDDSPLTLADEKANQIINALLTQTPYPIISEENKQIPYAQRQGWEYCWIVDPLDGTKEFIKKNGEFTVNIALCQNGVPIFGVIYVPVSRELYYGDVASGMAFKTVLGANHEPTGALFTKGDRIGPAPSPKKELKVVGSRSHMNAETETFINDMQVQYDSVDIVSKGSSLKYCLVAEGRAHVYPRFAPTMEWDTAAGSAIVEAVGLKVIARDTGKPLRYNKENLLNPYFLVFN
jgi:3'(2'), 5'-bisphosphate nucleotidase